jgi:hypothetical protein
MGPDGTASWTDPSGREWINRPRDHLALEAA